MYILYKQYSSYRYRHIETVLHFAAPEVTLSGIQLVSVTTTTLSVTWSADYPKCYSFTVSHSTQDGSINVTQPADSDTSHTLTSLQPGTTYRIEVEAVRKGDGADGQRARVMAKFPTATASECLQWDAFRGSGGYYSPPCHILLHP